ncbi:putative transcriptional regulator, MerR family protein [Paenibacillus mucilaginosus KNP414]|uniref:Putative transcriptional regulator, MerR family protein n=1 Tax=Paenibacillus mucilaginosus (strain KNP414) TaxID=1036673 RepID=F8FPF8_PAEMK|nr:putative transcriptional regulator, MerR family protein [Paenibacillus mucilaginosus KNP414]
MEESITFDCMVWIQLSWEEERLSLSPPDAGPIHTYYNEVKEYGDMKLYKIGELARLSEVSPRTIDYYTKLGLIDPETRSDTNYRLYSDETLARLKRIESMKREKYTLEEIKASLQQLGKVSKDEMVTDKLTSLQLLLKQLEKEAKEVGPMLEKLKPSQLKKLHKMLNQPTAACIEALLLLLGKGPFS